MANWSLPTVNDTWANILSFFKNRDEDLAKGLDPATIDPDPTNLPTNAIRWSSAAVHWEKFNGSTWSALAAPYNIAISGLAGSVEFANVLNKPTSLAGYGISDAQPLDGDLTALAALAATAGMLSRTGANAFAVRTLIAPAAGLTITDPTGAAGNPTFALANDLAALEALGSTGFAVRSGSDAWVQRSLTQPAAGLTIANNTGVGGNPTFALANDLAALEALAGTGFAERTGADTWVQRTDVVRTDLAQTLANKTHTNPANTDQTLTDASTVNWNMNSGGIATLTLTSTGGVTRTMNAPTNLKKGTYILHLIQGDSTARDITWNSTFKWSAGTPPGLSSGTGKHDIITFVCDGTNLYGAAVLDLA